MTHIPERCACGHYQLPPARDACAVVSPGVSDQHGRLSCERIALGAAATEQRAYGSMTYQRHSTPRAIGFERLDRC